MRLAAEVKLGYYPTPQPIAHILAGAFLPAPHDQPTAALDPFCGTGAALAAFPATLTYGSDLDADRMAEAQTRLTSTLHADAWALTPRPRRTSLLLLNPPYMDDPETRERQEIRALHTFAPWLHPQGFLVLIAPRKVVLEHVYAVDANYFLLACWRFPDPAYADFSQIIVIARPRRPQDPKNDWAAWLTTERPPQVDEQDRVWNEHQNPSWPRPLPPVLAPQWILPASTGFRLVARHPRVDQILPLLAHTPAWETLQVQTTPLATLDLQTPIRTPLTLHRGHLATLLTAGKLTGAIGTGEKRHLVRGRTIPYTVTTSETARQREEETRYRIEITTVHPDGTIRAWHEAIATSPDIEEVS